MVTGECLNEMLSLWRCLMVRPPGPINRSLVGCFGWHPRLAGLKKGALPPACDSARTFSADAAGAHGRDAVMGDRFIRGMRPKVAARVPPWKGTNWKVSGAQRGS